MSLCEQRMAELEAKGREQPTRRQRLEAQLDEVYAKRKELKAMPFPTDEESQEELAQRLENLDVAEGNLRGELAEMDYLDGEE